MGIFKRKQRGLSPILPLFFLLSAVTAYEECSIAGDGFQACIAPSCVGDTIKIRVDTSKPFEGIIHGPNRTEPGCFVEGRGSVKTFFQIDLTKKKGEAGYCGVRVNPKTGERQVAIAIREHLTIELVKDKLYVVGCRKAGYKNAQNEKTFIELRVTRPEDPYDRGVSMALEGEEYKIKVKSINPKNEYGILVRSCIAFNDIEEQELLIDDRGCRVKKTLMSEFSYNNTLGMAEATLYQMFKLQKSNKTYFQCDITICKGACPIPECDNPQAQNVPLLSNSTLSTSTSVFVVQPGIPGSAEGHLLCPVAEVYGTEDYFKYLFYAFATLFVIMLLVNIFLCSAMTCSCTKSEIIEKEPSIYSIYDSQYGYATGKTYGSESEYGSEYGAVDNQNYEEEEEDERPHSDTDTYHSKYSHHRRH